MTVLRVISSRLKALFAGARSDAELDEDVQAHLDLLAEEHLRRGLSPAEARAAARRDFGGVEQMKEAYRDQRGVPLLESLFQDLRHAGRALRRSPGSTLVAVVTIALGIFGPTVTFTMAKAWILDPLPFARPDELVDLRALDTVSGNRRGLNAADFLEWQRSARSFEEMAGYRQAEARWTGTDGAEHLRGAAVTPGFFRLLGIEARWGRLFNPSETGAEHSNLVVISHLMWRERLHGDPAAVGATLRLDGEDHTVIGVLPESFQFTLLGRCDVWRPLLFTPEQAADRRGTAMVGLARLRRGRTLEEARHELTQMAAAAATAYPDTNGHRGVRVLSLADEVRVHHDLGFIVPVMFVMVAFVLLIACFNTTSVMLARASTRRQEMAVRLALGASRSRIVRQWLVEHVLLFVASSAIGAALAVYGADWITNSIPVESRQYLRNYAALPVDRTVVIFALAVGALCGVLFGWVAARTSAEADVATDLRDASTRSTPGRKGARLRASLAISEVALALAVLICAGLLVRTGHNITRVDVGFEPRPLLTFQLRLDPLHYATPPEMRSFYERLTRDLLGRPGVAGAAAGSLVPFGQSGNRAEVFPEGSPETPPSETPSVFLNEVTADYGRTLGLRLLRGRLLEAGDGADAPRVALASETLVERYFPGQDPLGRRFRLGRGDDNLWTIVGVVGDVKNFETIDPREAEAYVPFAQRPRRAMTVVLRASGDPEMLAPTARAAVAALDPAEPIAEMASMDSRIHRVTAPYQTTAAFVAFFGAVTLLLAAVGVYGVVSYSFAQRTREIGIRMALGARRADVAWLVLGQIRTFLAWAVLPGLLLAWGLGHALRAMLVGVTPTDWSMYLSMTLLLALVALVAAFVPARRAMSIDPMTALHDE